MEDLHNDALFEIALRMDGPSLRKFCLSNKRANKICQNLYFRDSWIRYHDQLTFNQRNAIDNILDETVETLVNYSLYNLSNEDKSLIKQIVRNRFRTEIGRDLRKIIVKHIPEFIRLVYMARHGKVSDLIRSMPLHFLSNFKYFIHRILSNEYDIADIMSKDLPRIEDIDSYMDEVNAFSIIDQMIDRIFEINGILDLNDFENLVDVIPELKQYELEWYSLFPPKGYF